MDISVEKKGSVVVLKLKGDLDSQTVSFFKKKSSDLVDGGAVKFVLDATELSFVDSLGLGAMISLLRRVREQKGDVKIFGLTDDVKEIFEITRLGKLFDVCSSSKEAVEKYEGH
jgi:anti-sigma B factor antagonist